MTTPHKSPEQLFALLEKRSHELSIGSVWYHWKHPDVLYVLTDLVIDEATDEVAVVYEQQTTGLRFVRLVTSFLEHIHKENYIGPRFVPHHE